MFMAKNKNPLTDEQKHTLHNWGINLINSIIELLKSLFTKKDKQA